MSSEYTIADGSVRTKVEEIINKFPNKFLHINVNDIHFVMKDSETSTWKANVRLLRGFTTSLTSKKIGLSVWKQGWLTADETEKGFIVYHELMHILYDDETHAYKLRKHDVETFYEMLKEFGIDGEKTAEILGSVQPAPAN